VNFWKKHSGNTKKGNEKARTYDYGGKKDKKFLFVLAANLSQFSSISTH